MFTILDIMKVDKYLRKGATVPVDVDTVTLLLEAVKYYKENSFHAHLKPYGAKTK